MPQNPQARETGDRLLDDDLSPASRARRNRNACPSRLTQVALCYRPPSRAKIERHKIRILLKSSTGASFKAQRWLAEAWGQLEILCVPLLPNLVSCESRQSILGL